MTLRYIIVDDEPLAHNVIKSYAKEFEFLELKKQCFSALEAITYLHNNSTDLIFLDMEMPKLKGLDFIKSLKNQPSIIITTAYQEYALEGYEYDVTDYLLKPFSLPRFVKAINKLVLSNNLKRSVQHFEGTAPFILIKSEKKIYQIAHSDIEFLESIQGKVLIYTSNNTISSQEKLHFFEKTLPQPLFTRVHKSFIVALNKIKLVEGNLIHLEQRKIPIGRTYKVNLKRYFNNH